MLLPMEMAFSSPISAIAKVFVMMLGEFQYEDYFPFEKVRKKIPSQNPLNLFNARVKPVFLLFEGTICK